MFKYVFGCLYKKIIKGDAFCVNKSIRFVYKKMKTVVGNINAKKLFFWCV